MYVFRPRLTLKSIVIVATALLVACSVPQTRQDDQTTLYDRLGGLVSIEAVIDVFVQNVVADERISHYFADTDPVWFKSLLVEQVCEASGGPCRYSGRSMRAAHAGMRINEAEFAALVEDLQNALHTLRVPAAEQNELLTLLGSMQKDIVR
jgi:hemoglobin